MALAEKERSLRIPAYACALRTLNIRVRNQEVMNLCVYEALEPLAASGVIAFHPEDLDAVHRPLNLPWMTRLDTATHPTSRASSMTRPTSEAKRLCQRCELPLDDVITGNVHIVDNDDSIAW